MKKCINCIKVVPSNRRYFCSDECRKVEDNAVCEDRKVVLQKAMNELMEGTPKSEKVISKEWVIVDENGYRISG